MKEPDRLKDPEGWFGEKFVRFAQLLFEERKEGDYKWSPDLQKSELLITDAIPAPVQEIELRPVIQLSIDGYQSAGLTIDQRLWEDPYTGDRVHFDLFRGQATFHVLSKLDETAKKLSRILVYGLLQKKRTLMRLAKLQSLGQVVSRGPSSPPGSFVQSLGDVDAVSCSVSFPFFFTEAWKTHTEPAFVDPPPLRKIVVETKTESLRFRGKLYSVKKILD